MRYEMRDESGYAEEIEADDLEEAMDMARDWAADGSYDEPCMVTFFVVGLDEENEDEKDSDEVQCGPDVVPPRTECGSEDEDHSWSSAHDLVGGCESNPGVWSLGGTAFSVHHVCEECGLTRRIVYAGSQRNPGELDAFVEYEEAT